MIVITGDYGQLGNRLIVFANMIAAAREHGLRVVNPAFHEYADYFEGTCHDTLCRFPAVRARLPVSRPLQRLLHRGVDFTRRYARKFYNRTGRRPPGLRIVDVHWFERCNVDDPEFVTTARRNIVLARGWLFRAHQSFEQHADTVRAFFTPIERHRAAVARLVGRARRSAAVVVGVHIRHGDYRHFVDGQFFFPPRQYAALMWRVRNLLADRPVAFVVCSNTPQPADAFDGLSVHFGSGHEVEDLYALAGCDYLLGPPSTYTMWASFHGRVPLLVVTDADAAFDLPDFRVHQTLRRCTLDYSRTPVNV